MNIALKAEILARHIHSNQVDKAGKPYIDHLNAVVNGLVNPSDEMVAVAWLHDSVEDTNIEIDDIERDFGQVVADAINAITKRKNESYMDYIERVKSNSISKAVKISDLTHNMDLSRLSQISNKDIVRLDKYKKAKDYLITSLAKTEK